MLIFERSYSWLRQFTSTWNSARMSWLPVRANSRLGSTSSIHELPIFGIFFLGRYVALSSLFWTNFKVCAIFLSLLVHWNLNTFHPTFQIFIFLRDENRSILSSYSTKKQTIPAFQCLIKNDCSRERFDVETLFLFVVNARRADGVRHYSQSCSGWKLVTLKIVWSSTVRTSPFCRASFWEASSDVIRSLVSMSLLLLSVAVSSSVVASVLLLLLVDGWNDCGFVCCLWQTLQDDEQLLFRPRDWKDSSLMESWWRFRCHCAMDPLPPHDWRHPNRIYTASPGGDTTLPEDTTPHIPRTWPYYW